jgi:hypothetical protein
MDHRSTDYGTTDNETDRKTEQIGQRRGAWRLVIGIKRTLVRQFWDTMGKAEIGKAESRNTGPQDHGATRGAWNWELGDRRGGTKGKQRTGVNGQRSAVSGLGEFIGFLLSTFRFLL